MTYFDRLPIPRAPQLAQYLRLWAAPYAVLDEKEHNKYDILPLFQEIAMPKRDYHVVPNKDRGGWDVKREGAERSSGFFDRKSEAMERGRELARDNRTELVEHGRSGRIQDSDSYGRDPNPPKDKKH